MRWNSALVLVSLVCLVCLWPLPAGAQDQTEGPVTLRVAAPPFSYLGRPFTIRFEVSFQGPGVARQVQIVYPLSEVHVYKGGDPRIQSDTVNRRLVWLVGEMAPGQSTTAEATLVGARAGKVNPCAELSYILAERICPALEVRAMPGLHVTMGDDPDPIEVGMEVVYAYHVVNQGDADVTNLVLEAEIPAEMEFVSAMAAPGQSFQVNGRTVAFSVVAVLAPKERRDYSIRMRAVTPGDVIASCRAQYQEFSKPVVVQEGTTVYGR